MAHDEWRCRYVVGYAAVDPEMDLGVMELGQADGLIVPRPRLLPALEQESKRDMKIAFRGLK